MEKNLEVGPHIGNLIGSTPCHHASDHREEPAWHARDARDVGKCRGLHKGRELFFPVGNESGFLVGYPEKIHNRVDTVYEGGAQVADSDSTVRRVHIVVERTS